MKICIDFTSHELSDLIETAQVERDHLSDFLRHTLLKHFNIQQSPATPTMIHPLVSYFQHTMMMKYSITQKELANAFEISQQAVSKVFKGGSSRLSKEIIGFKNEQVLELEFVIPLFLRIYRRSFEEFVDHANVPESQCIQCYGRDVESYFHGSSELSQESKDVLRALVGYCWVLGYKKYLHATNDDLAHFIAILKAHLPIEAIKAYRDSNDIRKRTEAFEQAFESIGVAVREIKKVSIGRI